LGPSVFIPVTSITRKAMTARAAVTEMLPVAVAPPGSRPSRFMPRMKKKSVSRYGA
jgi:hypothetical protein